MSDFKPGEIVDITIKGARVLNHDTHGVLVFRYASDGEQASARLIYPDAEGVTVERVAPAEWPPQPGDLWRDRKGDVWFGRRYIADPDVNADWEGCNDDGWRPVLTPLDGGPYGYSSKRPDDVLREFGPLTLVRREDEQIGGAS